MDEAGRGQITKLLKETVVMLCKNGISFEGQMRVQGLIGVTLNDGTVILVHMNECVNEDGYSAADKPVENPADVSAKDITNKQYAKSHAASYVPVSENASLSLVHQSTLMDHNAENDVICVEAAPIETSFGCSDVKREVSGNWNSYSVQDTYAQPEYNLSDYTAVQLPEAQGNFIAVHDVTSQYDESFGSMSGHEESGLTHYSTASMSQKPRTPNLSARRGSSKRGARSYSTPRQSGKISAAVPQFSSSDRPTTSHQVSSRGHPPKRGRPRKIMPVSAEAQSSNGSKWDTIKLTTFACKLCGQTFNHQPNLLHHQIVIHGRQKNARGARRVKATFSNT